MSVHLVSSIAAPDWGAETVRVGDLNGDGAPDLLFAQSEYGCRRIECLTATTIEGERLWQWGRPSAANGQCYSDLPVQVYDWDGDGANEVLFVEQALYAEPIEYGEQRIRERAKRYEGDAWMVVLDAASGREKTRFAIPAPADDSLLFADLTGRGRRQDLVVKDRYWNMWGIACTGEVLWRWEGAVGHYPAIADVDGDGRDEVFVGFALIDHDGRELFSHDAGGAHQDGAYITQLPDGSWRLLFGNHGLHCLDVQGQEVWFHPLREAQHVVAGRYRPDSPLQVAVIDRGHPRTPEGSPGVLYLYDLEDGREIWQRRQPPGGWVAAALDIRWTGNPDLKEILVYERGAGQPVAIYDGWGEIVDTLEVPPEICGVYHGNPGIHICYRADVWGDSREEVLVAGWKGLRLYANARPLAIPTLYNNTLYHGM
ncbi:MAG: hypothetical protein IT369_02980 [Candidatus Latescibacteria bacterium]|nr:hypothetical protein [Candidatus Latescibacterota bacterium]